MALDGTYSGLQSAIAGWLTRADLTTQIKDFIIIFEAVANRRLKTHFQEITTTLTPSSGTATTPADYLGWRRLTWTGNSPRELEYVHPSYLRSILPTLAQGNPRYFSIEGTTITLGPSDNTNLTLDYYQKIPALSDSAPTNWLLTNYPDAYLWGSLAEAQGFTRNYDGLAAWASRREDVLNEIEKLDVKTRGPSSVRTTSPTP